jgi:hypothetical protein
MILVGMGRGLGFRIGCDWDLEFARNGRWKGGMELVEWGDGWDCEDR